MKLLETLAAIAILFVLSLTFWYALFDAIPEPHSTVIEMPQIDLDNDYIWFDDNKGNEYE
jgi:hypothetical protein